VSAGAQSGPRAFADAGVSPSEIDVLCAYESFTITVMCILEDLGFCRKGEGGAFMSEAGRLHFDGARKPVLNTDGGGLSSNHPGMRGIFTVIEATRQLRGQRGKAQVKDAKVALCHGTGGTLASGATAILSVESR
jgi:acetyl-CoA C-acetyltransferase